MVKVLFTRPSFDIATTYLSTYGALVVEKASQWGYSVTDLYKEEATLERFEAEIDGSDVFLGFGHGLEDLFTGQKIDDNLEILLKANVNAEVMNGKPCNLISCLCGVKLGPVMVEKTCPQFYGYQGDFVFMYHPDYYSQNNILEDPYAKPFFDSAIATAYAVLLEKTPAEIYEITLERYNYWWDFWIKQNDPLTDDILTWINWDRKNFVAVTPDGVYATPKPAAAGLGPLVLPIGAAALLVWLDNRGKIFKPSDTKN